MITKKFERTFILTVSGILLIGLAFIAVVICSVLPASAAGQFANARFSFAQAEDRLSGVITAAFIIESLIIAGLIVTVSVVASHKIAGPLYRLHSILNELANTRRAHTVVFREADQFQDTAHRFNAMTKGLNERLGVVSDAFEEFERTRRETDGSPESARRLKVKVDALGKAIERFTL